jgi:hypothetical protein
MIYLTSYLEGYKYSFLPQNQYFSKEPRGSCQAVFLCMDFLLFVACHKQQTNELRDKTTG